ncbi:SpoIIE family protein phosphatase [Streptomyces chartreusis]
MPLLIRAGRVAQQLERATTPPLSFSGEQPRTREHLLQPGDRVLCYTDIEEHVTGSEPFGEERRTVHREYRQTCDASRTLRPGGVLSSGEPGNLVVEMLGPESSKIARQTGQPEHRRCLACGIRPQLSPHCPQPELGLLSA